jgi:hypothetical protein
MATKKRIRAPKFVNPLEVTGSVTKVVTTLMNLKAQDFPEPSQVIQLIRELKVDADLSEMRLVAYLRAYELSELWKATSPRAHFDGWLRQYSTAFPDVVRYRNGVAALTQYGPEVCVRHGYKPIVAIASRLDTEHGNHFINQVLEPNRDSRKFPLSDVGVRDLIRDYKKDNCIEDKSPPRFPKSDIRIQLDEALAEVAKLKKENRSLRKERDQLANRLAQYEKTAGRKKAA